MLRTAFSFDLPSELIAQRPCPSRGGERLMVLGRKDGSVQHKMMSDLPSLIAPGTLMVFNDSRVRRARLKAIKESTGREHEMLFIRRVDKEGKVWRVLMGNARKQKQGIRYVFPDGVIGTVLENPLLLGTEERDIAFSKKCSGQGYEDHPITEDYFEQYGHIPLPPYIKRADDDTDAERYQNVYALHTGSAACPTAGLHFTNEMIERLEASGAEIAYVTLHVGLGTFLPVREENIEDHKMHQETYTISEKTAAAVNRAHKEGRPVLAVGTTSVRTLESAASESSNIVSAGSSSTGIFIYPGYKFKAVNMMFTNFHTPESTLLMLVSAFAGREHILSAYSEAVKKRYRFFSYGDAMLIL